MSDQTEQFSRSRSMGRDSITSLLKAGNSKNVGEEQNSRLQLGAQYNTGEFFLRDRG